MPFQLQTQPKSVPPLTSVFFLIDTSGRMCGQPIDAVNTAMRDAISVVQKYAQDEMDTAICYHVLGFDSGAYWMTYPCNIENIQWIDLRTSTGRSLGMAYRMLNEKLTRKEGGFFQEHANNVPIIILLLAGTPTDEVDSGLTVLRENKWFQQSIKIAIEFQEVDGFDFHHSALADFAGEDGIVVTNPNNLKHDLETIAINAAIFNCGIHSVAKDFFPHLYVDMENDEIYGPEYDLFEDI